MVKESHRGLIYGLLILVMVLIGIGVIYLAWPSPNISVEPTPFSTTGLNKMTPVAPTATIGSAEPMSALDISVCESATGPVGSTSDYHEISPDQKLGVRIYRTIMGIYDTPSHSLRYCLKRDASYISSEMNKIAEITFSSDNKFLAILSENPAPHDRGDEPLYIWDMETGQLVLQREISTFYGYSADNSEVIFSVCVDHSTLCKGWETFSINLYDLHATPKVYTIPTSQEDNDMISTQPPQPEPLNTHTPEPPPEDDDMISTQPPPPPGSLSTPTP